MDVIYDHHKPRIKELMSVIATDQNLINRSFDEL